jgi:hypothetical protein
MDERMATLNLISSDDPKAERISPSFRRSLTLEISYRAFGYQAPYQFSLAWIDHISILKVSA